MNINSLNNQWYDAFKTLFAIADQIKCGLGVIYKYCVIVYIFIYLNFNCETLEFIDKKNTISEMKITQSII